MKTFVVIRIYDDHKRIIHQQFCTCSEKKAEEKAKKDCEWLGGKSWEVSTLVKPF